MPQEELLFSVSPSSVQNGCSVVSDSLRTRPTACQTFLSITNNQSLLKLMYIKSVMPPNHLIFCHPLLLLPSIFPSIRDFPMSQFFPWGGQRIGASALASPFQWYSGMISYRSDWFDHLEVQGTLKSLLQHNSSKASILWHSAFFRVQLSHPYMATGKTIALTRWIFVGKVLICCLGRS